MVKSSIADRIESYLKKLIDASDNGSIELRRQYLAEKFACAPSQINYVLSTRFTDSHGYLVETRRGGSGYIKIIKLVICKNELSSLFAQLEGELCQARAEAFINRLYEEQLVTLREAQLMRAAVNKENLEVELPLRDKLRAKIFKAMLREVLRSH